MTENNTSPDQPPSLDLKDLGVMLNLINITVKRGAFEPNELAMVGNLFNKLERFIQYQAQMQAAHAAQQGEQ
jgi:hypothetical protein